MRTAASTPITAAQTEIASRVRTRAVTWTIDFSIDRPLTLGMTPERGTLLRPRHVRAVQSRGPDLSPSRAPPPGFHDASRPAHSDYRAMGRPCARHASRPPDRLEAS